MHLDRLLSLSSLLSLGIASAGALQGKYEDPTSGRRRRIDYKGVDGVPQEPVGKYFHEALFHAHYDSRFTDYSLDYDEQSKALKNLLQTYLAAFHDLGIETWLMHGTLLGWWWNKEILPWDSDIDVQVSESSIYFLAAYHNMSMFHFKTKRIPEGRDYMLEVNPHYKDREQTDSLNVIDARWIDTETGLFVDITAARYNLTHPAGEGMMYTKDGHEYRDTYVFPLRSTRFEGAPALIPYRYRDFLVSEYGEDALVKTEFEDHIFDEKKMEWVPNSVYAASKGTEQTQPDRLANNQLVPKMGASADFELPDEESP